MTNRGRCLESRVGAMLALLVLGATKVASAATDAPVGSGTTAPAPATPPAPATSPMSSAAAQGTSAPVATQAAPDAAASKGPTPTEAAKASPEGAPNGTASVPSANAEDDWAAKPETLHLDATLTTDFPVATGVRLTLESSGGAQLSTSFGYMPPAFMDLMSGLMFASEPEKQPTDQMLKTATRDAFVWRTHLGLKPFEDIGWYAQAGYGLILAGGGGDPSTRVAAATDLPAGPANERFTLKTSATVHVLDLETGWQWRFGQRWVVRAAVGGTFAMAAVAKASPEDLGNYRYDPKSPEFDALDPLRPRVETLPFAGRKLLERKLESTIQTPVVSLGVGYAFF